jgi:hypothetical protein
VRGCFCCPIWIGTSLRPRFARLWPTGRSRRPCSRARLRNTFRSQGLYRPVEMLGCVPGFTVGCGRDRFIAGGIVGVRQRTKRDRRRQGPSGRCGGRWKGDRKGVTHLSSRMLAAKERTGPVHRQPYLARLRAKSHRAESLQRSSTGLLIGKLLDTFKHLVRSLGRKQKLFDRIDGLKSSANQLH